MKRILSLTFLVILVLSLPIIAQEPIDSELVDPGTTPDNPFYFLDLAMENLAIALTFDIENKIELKLKHAEERLSEARVMAFENKVDKVSEAKIKFEEISKEIKIDVEEISKDKEKVEGKIKIEQKIKILENKVNNVEREVKIKIEIEGDLTQEQRDLISQLMSSFGDNNGGLEIEIKEKEGESKLKIKQKTDSDEKEIESDDDESDDDESDDDESDDDESDDDESDDDESDDDESDDDESDDDEE